MLEDELREVIIHRDEIEQDNFDELIKKSSFIDLDEPGTFEELLAQAAPGIAGETGMKEEEVISRYRKRQVESNMAVSDFLAIPHILIDGENRMFLRIIRCREGVDFGKGKEKVKACLSFRGYKGQAAPPSEDPGLHGLPGFP